MRGVAGGLGEPRHPAHIAEVRRCARRDRACEAAVEQDRREPVGCGVHLAFFGADAPAAVEAEGEELEVAVDAVGLEGVDVGRELRRIHAVRLDVVRCGNWDQICAEGDCAD